MPNDQKKAGLGLPTAPPPPDVHSDDVSEESETRVLRINMSGVTTEFVPVPVGLYPAVVEGVEYVSASKKSGQPGLRWIFVTTVKPHAGRKFFYHTSLVEQAMWKLAKTLDALGMENVADNPDLKLDLDEMTGLPCTLSISIGSYQGKPKNEIVDVLPMTELGAVPPPF
jgi:hypothetical protein